MHIMKLIPQYVYKNFTVIKIIHFVINNLIAIEHVRAKIQIPPKTDFHFTSSLKSYVSFSPAASDTSIRLRYLFMDNSSFLLEIFIYFKYIVLTYSIFIYAEQT